MVTSQALVIYEYMRFPISRAAWAIWRAGELRLYWQRKALFVSESKQQKVVDGLWAESESVVDCYDRIWFGRK